MLIFYTVLLLLFGGGLASLALGSRERALTVASVSVVAASCLGFGFSLYLLVDGATLSGNLPFPLPLGHCLFAVDPLSSAFLLPVFLLAALGGALLPARIRALEGAKAHDARNRDLQEGDIRLHKTPFGRHGFFYCTLVAAMVLVLIAGDAVFFLIAWEIMSLAPFFLISPQDKDSKERHASWIYLIAAHLGALPLLLLFAGMTVEAGASGFFALAAYGSQGLWINAGLFFILALVGFGVKVGLVPLHMWMPEAHASAPGHVAVLLSGTMLNLGLYGIMRALTLLGPSATWWAYTLMGAGAFSGILGILIGLAQSDMKRTLAYSSAENMGIVCLALGAALLAGHFSAPAAASLLLGGAFLHMWNHSVFKSLLFLAANAVKETTHVTTIQRLGGLHKRIPFTGGCFALGSAAIAGIPPLNGFMSEMLIYIGFALGGEASRGSEASVVFWLAFFILGSIAGMAVFAFTRMFGLVFLGTPRGPESLEAKEPEPLLKSVMLFLAALCLGISVAGPLLFSALTPLLHYFSLRLGLPVAITASGLAFGEKVLAWYAFAGVLLLALLGLAAWFRRRAVERNGFSTGLTWDCGYRFPSARMQYTGGSFAHTLALILKPLLRPFLETPKIKDLFPGPAQAVMTTPDWPTTVWERYIFRPVAFVAEASKGLQHGLVNLYILYIFIALMAALVWALGWS